MIPNAAPNGDDDEKAGLTTTAVANVKHIPLDRLSEHADRMLRRIVPPADTLKAPVATFEASL